MNVVGLGCVPLAVRTVVPRVSVYTPLLKLVLFPFASVAVNGLEPVGGLVRKGTLKTVPPEEFTVPPEPPAEKLTLIVKPELSPAETDWTPGGWGPFGGP